ESYSPDTLKKHARLAKELSLEQKNPRATILSDFYLSAWLFQVNKLDSAFSNIEHVLRRYKASFTYDEIYVKLYGLKGNILNRTAKLNDLMAHNFELIQLAEEKKDTFGMARGTIGIGNVNSKLKKYDEALQWYHKALALMKNSVYKGKLSFVYNNTGIVFFHLQNQDSALFYVKEGIKYSRDEEALTDLANSLFLYGGLLSEYNRLEEAEQSFKEAIEVRRRIGDIYFLVTDMGQLAFFYANTKKSDKGIALCKEAIKLAEENGPMYSNMSSLYEVLGKNYLAAGNYKNYSEALVKMLELKDSVYKINSAEQMAEQETRFEVQKKEATIAKQKLKLIRRNLLVYGSLLFFMVVLVTGWFVFRRYRQRQKLKMERALEQEKKIAAHSVKEAEEKERKRIAADLHDNLGVQANAILYNTELLKQENTGNDELVGDLHDTAKEMLLNLRETLWAMKTSDIMAADLWLRIISFCKQMGRHYTLIKFTTEGNAPANVFMPSARALNIVMMIQEAVNNAVKHSGANKIIIKSNMTDKGWQLRVLDNGHGFDLQRALKKNDSNGLRNMQERARAAGLNLNVEANQEGTCISIDVVSI
ncbi:MAG TPA: tetratricopeptide repeat protein, partial [Chitinophagaceae bacterium]|nr:tetratricopeptide repeat protein [Chitinophagaceae bacterium]